MRINTAVAAAIVACFGLWWVISPASSGGRLYAAMKEALQSVDSFHVVTSIADADGELHRVAETWFQRDGGFAVDQPDVIRIDDGEFFWEYTKGSDTAVRRPSQDPDELLDQAIGIKEELEQDCERFEAGDKNVDGRALKCYQVTFHGDRRPADQSVLDFTKKRTYVFVDDQWLVRSIESQENVDGHWQLKLVREWDYNVDIAPKVFSPDFGDEVTIINGDEVFDELTDVANSVLTEERDGLIYTIHEAHRFEDGGVLVMSSVRGSKKTLQKYPLQRRMIQPGLYITDGPAVNYDGSPQGGGTFRLSLATAQQNGVHVEWWMMVPRGRKPDWFEDQDGRVTLQLGIRPQGKYAEEQHADADGVIHHITWTAALDLPTLDPLPSLADLAHQVYEKASLLQPVAWTALDMGVEDINGTPHGRRALPDEVTSQQFVDAVYDHWRWWEDNDVEFQLTQGVKTTSLPGIYSDHAIPPTIGVSYYSVVDDRTLERAAQNPELEVLFVRGTRITDAGLATLSGLRHLRQLDISETEISDAGLQHLERIESLEGLSADQTNVTQDGVERLKQSLPDLDVTFSPRDQPKKFEGQQSSVSRGEE